MRIAQFKVQGQKIISLAHCDNVPQLMVIAGPNGCGKTTLLSSLRHQPGSGPILYVGPHRNTRRQEVQKQYLQAGPISMRDVLAKDNIPGYAGIAFVTGSRDPWSFDDSGNYLKFGLCQIEIERIEAVAASVVLPICR